MHLLHHGKLLLIILVIMLSALMAGACAAGDANGSEEADDVTTTQIDSFDTLEPVYQLNVDGHTIRIYRPSPLVFYAYHEGSSNFSSEGRIIAVLSKLAAEGYTITQVRFHPVGNWQARHMFIYVEQE